MADIDIGQITEALNDKADRNLQNVDTTAKADAVIDYQEPTADNGYTWYRKYASGWVEQGGVFPATSGWATSTISLPITMQDMYYTLTNDHAWETSDTLGSIIILTKTTTNFSARYFSRAAAGYSTWFIAGMTAN